MKGKIGWILFSIMTVAVIVLSSVLISCNERWVSGDELLDIKFEDVKSAYLYHNIIATAEPKREEYNLSETQIRYIIYEFHKSKLEKNRENFCGGSSGVVFKLKDGSERMFIVIENSISINGKQYLCHSYLCKYITEYGFDE